MFKQDLAFQLWKLSTKQYRICYCFMDNFLCKPLLAMFLSYIFGLQLRLKSTLYLIELFKCSGNLIEDDQFWASIISIQNTWWKPLWHVFPNLFGFLYIILGFSPKLQWWCWREATPARALEYTCVLGVDFQRLF